MLKSISRFPVVLTFFMAPLALAAPDAAHAFGFPDVVQIAKKLAAKPYKAPPSVPSFLTKLSYDEYSQIHFRAVDTLWRQNHSKFQVVLTAPGEHYQHLVQINVIEDNQVHTIPFHKDWFDWPANIASKIPEKLGYAGFKLTFPLDQPDEHNQFLVFAGASYFRGIARNEDFGLSARAVAIDTGLASGEQFPDFTRFWLVKPTPHAKGMQFYALLTGQSLTGAYQFVVFPGAPTNIEIHAKLFIRKPVKLLGLAPLTGMFFYGANTPRPASEWRPAVHDSGGLLIHSGTGEWLWHPLINPTSLQMNYFEADAPKGFGLLQRATGFADYEDTKIRYDQRPSAWVTPQVDWGAGRVVLVEIPTKLESNDNIVAFWTPKAAPKAGQVYNLHYTLRFGAPTAADEPVAHAVATYVGNAPAPGTQNATPGYHLVVDFAGGQLDAMNPDTKVEAVVTGVDGTKVKQHQVTFVEPSQQWRLSIHAVPASGKPLALRAFLKQGKATLSETWTYSLPTKNRFPSGG